MSITIQERQKYLDQFKQIWPVERLQAMKLEEYSSIGDKNSLVYWLEFGIGHYLGSSKGGDSSKFGIYERKAEPKGQRQFISSDERYSWNNKYGNSATEAFATIHKNIMNVINFVQAGNITGIEVLDFESSLKWKLAFIYQDHTKPLVLPIYKLKKFNQFMDGKVGYTHADAYTKLLAERNGKSALEYGVELWQKADALEGKSDEDFDNSDVEDENNFNTHDVPLNKILFGPPGTGKTYVSIEAAVLAAEPNYHWDSRVELKLKYKELVDAGRIAFVTFHQSYSYEDFVEGLTANSENGQVQYTPKNGVFKNLVVEAKKQQHSTEYRVEDSFEVCWDLFLEQLSEQPEAVKVTTRRTFVMVTEVDGNTIRFDKAGGESVHSLSVSTLRELFNQQRIIKGGLQPYYESLINHIKALGQKLGQKQNATSVTRKNFVLVIDEINRGNISRIFGELITLIEPSKRLGNSEPLEVKLPLTGDKFSVPNNLYIIGTMNTADRSLAGLDLALRRRFTFIEMPPRPELLDDVDVEGVNIGVLMRVMNQRIAVLLDRDHCIGHAYFMPLVEENSLLVLRDIFKQKIIPLLQEYFFEDWLRIRWVLNDQNKTEQAAFVVEDKSLSIETLFPGVESGLPNRTLWTLNHAAFDNITAYQGIV